jgi:Domain of Unknown Function (DUF1080)
MKISRITFACSLPVFIFLSVFIFSSCGTAPKATTDSTGFVSIFDGKTLDGWKGNPTYWKVENGSIVGEITPATLLKTNSFLVWQGGDPADFELKLECRITKDGNSGINYRSVVYPDVPDALKGYQADIDGAINYTGQNYEERGRTTLAYRGEKATINVGPIEGNVKNNAWQLRNVTGSLGSADSLKALIKYEDWNQIHLVIKGNVLKHYVNGILMSEVIDNDNVNGKSKGLLGVQVHVGPPMKVEYRNIMLKQ